MIIHFQKHLIGMFTKHLCIINQMKRKMLVKLPPIVYLHFFLSVFGIKFIIHWYVALYYSIVVDWILLEKLLLVYIKLFVCAWIFFYFFWILFVKSYSQLFPVSFCLFVGIALKLMSLSYLFKISSQCKPICVVCENGNDKWYFFYS